MRVLHLIETEGPGGAENVLYSIVVGLDPQFESLTGLLHDGWLSSKLQACGQNVIILRTNRIFDFKILRNIIEIINKYNIQIIHSHLLDMNFYSSLAAALKGIPHISTEHGDVHHAARKLTLRTRIKAKIISTLSKKIVFVSKYTEDKFIDITALPKKKSSVVYNGIDLSAFEIPADIRQKKEEIGICKSDLIIGNVANLYPVKGQTYLLKAARQIIDQIPNVKLLLIGRGPLEDELKKETLNLGIYSSVKYLQFRDDVKELLKSMDIFVLSSLSEGLPVSLIEAMASKVPIVTTNVGGIPEIIKDGENGFLVKSEDHRQLANKVIVLLKNKDIAHKFTNAAYNKVKNELTLQCMISKYQALYRQLIINN